MNGHKKSASVARSARRKLAAALRATIEALEGRMLLTGVVVNTVSDSAAGAGVVTLSDAVEIADASTSPTTITFDPTVFAMLQTIVAPAGGFSEGNAGLGFNNTSAATTIVGPSAGVIINNADFPSNVCTILPDVTASLSNITLEGAGSDYCGIHIDNQGTITLTNVAVSGNNAGTGGGAIGGGITNDGTATLVDCTISGNTSERGGGIYNVGTAMLSNVAVSENTAYNADGGIQNTGSITLTGCTVSGNTASGNGGGISNSGTMTLTGSTVSDNVANLDPAGDGGGIYNSGEMTLTDSTVSGNTASAIASAQEIENDYNGLADGGGIYNFGMMTLTGSTVSGNEAFAQGGTSPFARGGGIDNDGTKAAAALTLINSTVSGNTAFDQGGAIAAVGGGIDNSSYGNFTASATLFDVTISGNTSSGDGGGLHNGSSASSLEIANSIVAGNIAAGDMDAEGTLNSLGFNLVGETDGSAGWNAHDLTGDQAAPLDAKLGSLANYGGPTQTLIPLAGSPAIDAGSNALIPSGITTDQRGLARVVNGTVDIGADEYVAGMFATSTTTLAVSSDAISLGASVTLTATVASSGTGESITGTVGFTENGAALGSAQVQANGTATLATSSLPAGTNTIAADYGGDSAHTASASAPETVTVAPIMPSVTTVTSISPNPAGEDTTIAIGGNVASSTGGGATPTGSVTVHDGSIALGDATVQSDGSFTFSISSLPPGTDIITASYSGDSVYATSASSPQSEIVTASTAVPAFGNPVLPSSLIAGAKFTSKLPVSITNQGSPLKGLFTIDLYADTTTAINGDQSLLASIKQEISLKTGKGKAFNFNLLSLPASLAAGTYYLLAQVIDPTGATYTTASAQTVQVAAPFISLAASVGTVTPASILIGKSGSIAVTVTNNGNEVADGLLDLTLSPSLDGVNPLPITLVAHVGKTNVKVGRSQTFKLHFKLTSALSAGRYHPFLSVSFAGVSTTAVGAVPFTAMGP